MQATWQRYRHGIIALFFLLLPWQTRWIAEETLVYGRPSEFGRISVYGFEVVLVALLLMAIVGIGRSQWRRWWEDKRRRWMAGMVGVVIALGLISMMWAPETHVAIQGWIRLLLATGLFTVLVTDEEISVDVVLASFVVGLIVPSLVGWLQVAHQSVDASTVLGMAAQDPAVQGTAVIEWAQGRWLRAYGTFPHPNVFGGFLAFGLVAIVAVVARARLKTSDLLFWLAAAMMGGALVMTASRGAWLAAVLGLLIFIVGHRRIGRGDAWKKARSPMLLGLMVAVIVAVSLSPILRSRFDASNRLEERSVGERIDQWGEWASVVRQGAVAMIVGRGVGTYPFALQGVRPLQAVWMYQPIHIVPALVVSELGAIGGMAALAFVVMLCREGCKSPRRSEAVIALSLGAVVPVLAFTDHYLWTQPSGLYLLFMFFAVGMRLAWERRPVEGDRS